MFAYEEDAVTHQDIITPKNFSRLNLPLTPGRIPTFIIPPRLSLSPRLGLQKGKEEDTRALISPESPEEQSPRPRSTKSPYISAKFSFTPKMKLKRSQKSTPEDLSDPSTCAAMSLEHVGKVTTPYGFRTLAASPQVNRRESLFHKQGRSVEKKGLVDSLVSPASSLTLNSASKKNRSAKKMQDGTDDCCSPRRSKREGLERLLNKPLTVLKNLTPKGKSPHLKLKV